MIVEQELEGYDELVRALSGLTGDQTQALAVTAMSQSCLAVEGFLKAVPGATDANRPGRIDDAGHPMGYYERNRGEWYPIKKVPKGGVSKFGKVQGIVRAGKAQRGQGVFAYKLNPTSEQLSKSWTSEIQVGNAEIVGIVGTDVTYAPAVQGINQTALFAQIGWPRIDTALEQAAPDIQAAWNEMLNQIHF